MSKVNGKQLIWQKRKMELSCLLLIFTSLVNCYPSVYHQDERYKFDKSLESLRDDVTRLNDILRWNENLLADAIKAEELTEAKPSIRDDFQEYMNERYYHDNEDKRIVNGQNARKGGFPWQVGIYYDGDFLCGGTLISLKYVMTAAHCFHDPNLMKYEVYLGEYERKATEAGVQKRKIKAFVIHEDYRKGSMHANDIAIIKLQDKATQSSRVYPACLPDANDVLKAGDGCVLTGWGREYAWGEPEKILKELSTPIVSHEECQRKNERRKVTSSMLCTGSSSSFASGCMGDSGGPLSCIARGTHKWKVYGVVSWGSSQCNGLNKYTVYTKVRMYLKWIKEKTEVTPKDVCFRDDP